jgi:lycopene cyclase domain-containing protein
MTSFLYLSALVVSLLGLGFLDLRYRVALWDQPKRAAVTVLLGVLFFVIWDAVGIGLGIFFRGDGPYMTGILVAPELPIEELFFLTLLVYQTLLVWRALDRRASKRVAS